MVWDHIPVENKEHHDLKRLNNMILYNTAHAKGNICQNMLSNTQLQQNYIRIRHETFLNWSSSFHNEMKSSECIKERNVGGMYTSKEWSVKKLLTESGGKSVFLFQPKSVSPHSASHSHRASSPQWQHTNSLFVSTAVSILLPRTEVWALSTPDLLLCHHIYSLHVHTHQQLSLFSKLSVSI